MTTGKEKESEVATWSKSAWGFSKATTQPPSTAGTAGAFEFCSTRPHGIFLVEVSTSCLPDAGYVRCRGREQS